MVTDNRNRIFITETCILYTILKTNVNLDLHVFHSLFTCDFKAEMADKHTQSTAVTYFVTTTSDPLINNKEFRHEIAQCLNQENEDV